MLTSHETLTLLLNHQKVKELEAALAALQDNLQKVRTLTLALTSSTVSQSQKPPRVEPRHRQYRETYRKVETLSYNLLNHPGLNPAKRSERS